MTTAYSIRFRGRVTGPYQLDEVKRMLNRGMVTAMHEVSKDLGPFQSITSFQEFGVLQQQEGPSPPPPLAPAAHTPIPPGADQETVKRGGASPRSVYNLAKPLATIAAVLIVAIAGYFAFNQFKGGTSNDVEHLRRAVVMIAILDDNHNTVSYGSGFFVSESGHIVTNRHVLDRLSRGGKAVAIWDTPEGTDKFKGSELRVVSLPPDPNTDLALLCLHGSTDKDFDVLKIGTDYRVGQEIQAVGFPIPDNVGSVTGTSGLDIVVTRGFVSSLRRLGKDVNYLAIDARIAPGNSGGPLIDANSGHVLGVITMAALGDGGDNVNLAIPAHEIQRFFGSFIK
jgi:S1-C subfamily serine protease